jgi:hypothetical protein
MVPRAAERSGRGGNGGASEFQGALHEVEIVVVGREGGRREDVDAIAVVSEERCIRPGIDG